jgi:hypothetical protein
MFVVAYGHFGTTYRFFMCNHVLYNCFSKMFLVFYAVNLYICVFMSCQTACCLYDTLIDQWNVYVYVCMCTYTYIYTHIHTYICVCVCMYSIFKSQAVQARPLNMGLRPHHGGALKLPSSDKLILRYTAANETENYVIHSRH